MLYKFYFCEFIEITCTLLVKCSVHLYVNYRHTKKKYTPSTFYEINLIWKPASSVWSLLLVALQTKWTWTDRAGPQSGVAIVTVFTALAVISGCVFLAVLSNNSSDKNQHLSEKFSLFHMLIVWNS